MSTAAPEPGMSAAPDDPSPEQPGTWVTVLTGDMGNMFQFLFMLH